MGEDCLSTIDCFRKMGVEINITDDEVIVEGVGLHGLEAPSEALYTGNSGTTTRLLCGILAGQPFTVTMNGDPSIQKRPMGRVMKPLREMGASIEGKNDNFCPLTLFPSELHGIEYRLPVASRSTEERHPAGRSVRRGSDDRYRAGSLPRPHRAPCSAHSA